MMKAASFWRTPCCCFILACATPARATDAAAAAPSAEAPDVDDVEIGRSPLLSPDDTPHRAGPSPLTRLGVTASLTPEGVFLRDQEKDPAGHTATIASKSLAPALGLGLAAHTGAWSPVLKLRVVSAQFTTDTSLVKGQQTLYSGAIGAFRQLTSDFHLGLLLSAESAVFFGRTGDGPLGVSTLTSKGLDLDGRWQLLHLPQFELSADLQAGYRLAMSGDGLSVKAGDMFRFGLSATAPNLGLPLTLSVYGRSLQEDTTTYKRVAQELGLGLTYTFGQGKA